MVDVRLTYDKGLDKYYGLLDLTLKYGIFKNVSTRIELPDGSKTFGKTINNNPEKYFTEDIMKQLDECAMKESLSMEIKKKYKFVQNKDAKLVARYRTN